MKQFDAVLFDIDGTLLDTTQFIQQAFFHSLKTNGGPNVTVAEIKAVVGKPLPDCYQILYPTGDVATLCETHDSFQMKNLHLSVPFQNTIKVLNELIKAEMKIAAVTSRPRHTSEKILVEADMIKYFDTFVFADDVENHKPHPEPLLKALHTLNIAPENAVMIGDTSADVGAGKNANTKTIGVTYGFHGQKIRESMPDFVVDDIEEILNIILKQD
jgi:pyrophosphatase PpaX